MRVFITLRVLIKSFTSDIVRLAVASSAAPGVFSLMASSVVLMPVIRLVNISLSNCSFMRYRALPRVTVFILKYSVL